MNTMEGADGRPTQLSQADGSEVSAWQHECEWTAEADAEADLHKHYNKCPKNPGHKNFIPIHQFSIDHLPPGFRYKDMVEWIQLLAVLTVKVCVRYTSMDRPEIYPDTEEGKKVPDYKGKVDGSYPFSNYRGTDILRTGTGFVLSVTRHQRGCKCEVHCPHKDWGEVMICTACHVVYDKSEAEKTELIFHYDSEENQEKIRKERGRGVQSCNMEKDVCCMYVFSHDVRLLDRLEETLRRRSDLPKVLSSKYIIPTFDGNGGFHIRHKFLHHFPVIIISHPHGQAKMITIGELKDVLEGQMDDKCSPPNAVFNYTADTCPGSSGAQVFFVPYRLGLFNIEHASWIGSTLHSYCLENGVNRSASKLSWVYLWWWRP